MTSLMQYPIQLVSERQMPPPLVMQECEGGLWSFAGSKEISTIPIRTADVNTLTNRTIAPVASISIRTLMWERAVRQVTHEVPINQQSYTISL